MSGIAGILDLDGGPIDRLLLDRLTKFMQFRGPDALETWNGGRVGFGHTMLRTTFESQRERQPLSLDGRVWIVADARVDGRSELCRKLRSAGHDVPRSATDPELILRAYRVWGGDCVRHLLGDFAFAIWDGPGGALFCARDHFGVKPFYYAQAGNCLVFSNTLNCVREHPAVTDELNDLAIADFLLSDYNQDEASTSFADIHRLAPAHRMTWSEGALRVDRYWDLPSDGHLRYRNAHDYVEHFTECFDTAVVDRLRSNRIAVFMSGGLDSTSVAATARTFLAKQHDEFDLRAYTCVSDGLFVDEERHFSGLAADALGIPIDYLVADDYALFEGWRTPGLLPEPVNEPLSVLYLEQARQVASHARVVLTGWDGDCLLNEDVNRCGGIVYRSLKFAHRATRVGWRALSRGRWPRLDLRARLTRMLSGAPEKAFACPEWLNPDLLDRLDLPARWREIQKGTRPRVGQHAEAHSVLTSPILTALLESYDPGVTRIPVEARHPLFDLRLVEFLLSLPTSPWCVDKKLLRMAMHDRLPESIRLRPKTVLAGDLAKEMLRRGDAHWVDAFEAAPTLGRYVDRAALPPIAGGQVPERLWTDLRALCLNFWLQQLTAPDRVTRREEYYEVI